MDRDQRQGQSGADNDRRRLKAMGEAGDIDGLITELSNPTEHPGRTGEIRAFGVVRDQAILELARLGDTQAVGPIEELLQDHLADVRADAVSALGKLGDPGVVERLLEMLSDEAEHVQGCVVRSLGQLGDERAVDGLSTALHNENPRMRLLATRALARIGGAPATKLVRNAVRHESPRHLTIYLRMVFALKKMGRAGSCPSPPR